MIMVEEGLNPHGAQGDDNPSAKEAVAAVAPTAAIPRDLYGWLDPEVQHIRSKYLTPESLDSLRDFLEDKRGLDQVDCLPYSVEDHLHHSSENHGFFFYARVCVRFPFTAFVSVVLRALNVAPSQLHPNSWCFVRVFEIVCKYYGITATIKKFFNFLCQTTWRCRVDFP